jgi:hypothetical protein
MKLLEDCKKCNLYISYQYGYILCHYSIYNEQRIVTKTPSGELTIIGCPKNNE